MKPAPPVTSTFMRIGETVGSCLSLRSIVFQLLTRQRLWLFLMARRLLRGSSFPDRVHAAPVYGHARSGGAPRRLFLCAAPPASPADRAPLAPCARRGSLRPVQTAYRGRANRLRSR